MTSGSHKAHFTDAQLDEMYEASKRDFQFVGSEIRQLIGDIRTARAAITASPGEQKPPTAAGWNEAIDAAALICRDAANEADGNASRAAMAEELAATIESLRREAPAPEGVADADVIGDAATLRGFIDTYKMTPSMMASEMEIWKERALAAAPSRPDAGGGVREAFVSVLASLAAAISLLERMPKAKKAAPSDTMFAIMLDDYRKALETGRAALSTPPAAVESNASVEARLRGGPMSAQWTYDPEAEAYYFAPMTAAPGPYLKQRHVDAIIDIASDGTLAGVELIDNMPPPPVKALSAVGDGAKKSEGIHKPSPAFEAAYSAFVENVTGRKKPSDPTAERREIVARFKSVVQIMRSANKQGWLMCIWNSDIETMDAILAALDGGACA